MLKYVKIYIFIIYLSKNIYIYIQKLYENICIIYLSKYIFKKN